VYWSARGDSQRRGGLIAGSAPCLAPVYFCEKFVVDRRGQHSAVVERSKYGGKIRDGAFLQPLPRAMFEGNILIVKSIPRLDGGPADDTVLQG
jgi:hypothetical protein